MVAAVSYLPLLATKPGVVAADTKQYLYIDPGRLLASAASMWNPDVGMGTVTHQNIGYLFPMGPWFWAVHALGVPVWLGQRLWMGTLLACAGLGVRFACRQLGVTGWGGGVAALMYLLSPYTIDYLARSSAILLPWAGLGWLLGLTVLAARRGGWRHPALFAIVVALVGGVNATSVVLAGLAPLLWLVYAGAIRDVAWRRAVAVGARIGALSLLVSLWWIVGLWVEARYGFDILRTTETLPTVARTSSAAEVLRGLGYWYFYGQDKVQPWTMAAPAYTQSLWLIAVSFAVPAAAVALGFMARWRYRAFAVALVAGGTLVAVGVYPYGHPSPFGGLLKAVSASSGLAARSVNRAVPLVVLGLALLAGSGIDALSGAKARFRATRFGVAGLSALAAALCAALVAADIPPLWSGEMVASNLSRQSSIPGYWLQAAGYLGSRGAGTRVLGLPGEDFAAYRWGIAEDQIGPALLERPYVQRQVVPQGEAGSVDLLQALDAALQEQTLDPAAIAPMARLMSAGQVLLQSDLQYERYALPLPQVIWQQLDPAPAGLSQPAGFGSPAATKPIKYPQLDQYQLGLPTGASYPPPLAVFSVPGARPIVRAEPADEPLVVAGSGQGLLEAAGAGLLGGDQSVFYSGSFASDPAGLARLLAAGAALLVTDTNRLAADRWGSLRDNTGVVQQARVAPLATDPSNYPIPLFPTAGDAARTVAVMSGVESVKATEYGNPLTYAPENAPANAVDANPATAWTAGTFGPGTGQDLQINLERSITADHITLLQAQSSRPTRHITRISLRFDGGRPNTVDLGPASWAGSGQTVRFPPQHFHRLDITVVANTPTKAKRFDDQSPVGFAEVEIPGVTPATTALRMPTDLLAAAGASSVAHRLILVMDRIRALDVPRSDPEPAMARQFTLPTARTFTLGGTARISPQDSDYLINQLIGLTPPGPLPAPSPVADPAHPARLIAANSSTRLVGDLRARANAATDGDPTTAWIAQIGPQAGAWLSYSLDRSVSFDHLDLQVVADARHSIPTSLTVTADGVSRKVEVPPIDPGRGRAQGAVTKARVSFPTLNGSQVRITIDTVAPVKALDYFADFTNRTDILPVGIAEVGLPGVTETAPPATIPSMCRQGLFSIDGQPTDIEVDGPTSSALAGSALQIRLCGASSGGISLGPGTHTLRTSPRLPVGLTLDSITLSSGAGSPGTGSPGTGSPGAGPPATTPGAPAPAPTVRVLHQDRTHLTLRVTPAEGQGATASGEAPAAPAGGVGGFWLVLGQSHSDGWHASLPGGKDLGRPTLIDGYANGWYIPPGVITHPTTVQLEWTPQRVVWAAIAVSAAALAVLIAVAAGLPAPCRRRRRRRTPRGARAGWSASRSSNASTAQTSELNAVAGPPDLAPTLANPLRSGGRRPRPWAILALTAVCGLGAGVASGPLVAAIVAALVLVALALDRARALLSLGAVVALVSAATYVIIEQHRYHYWPTINWPSNVDAANGIAWLAVCLLAADAAVVAGRAGTLWRR
ncbi:MAG: alpha-(1-_3)-arabinofuranosyltransferase domain-containing protein [Acidimicrobiales bacterium]